MIYKSMVLARIRVSLINDYYIKLGDIFIKSGSYASKDTPAGKVVAINIIQPDLLRRGADPDHLNHILIEDDQGKSRIYSFMYIAKLVKDNVITATQCASDEEFSSVGKPNVFIDPSDLINNLTNYLTIYGTSIMTIDTNQKLYCVPPREIFGRPIRSYSLEETLEAIEIIEKDRERITSINAQAKKVVERVKQMISILQERGA